MKIVAARDLQLQREVDYGTPEQNAAVKDIIRAVREEGDQALQRYTELFDKVSLSGASLRVSPEELTAAYDRVEPTFVEAIRAAAARSSLSCQAEAHILDGSAAGRYVVGSSIATSAASRCICAWWKSRVSILRANECHTCTGGRSS